MKINYFKFGAIAYMVLGAMHELSHLTKGNINDSKLANTLAEMENTTIHFLGEHSLMKFYDGFSLTMGFLLLAFGLQAFVTDKPGKKIVLVDILVTLITLILTILYFHIIAWSFMGIALVCFVMSYIQMKKAQI